MEDKNKVLLDYIGFFYVEDKSIPGVFEEDEDVYIGDANFEDKGLKTGERVNVIVKHEIFVDGYSCSPNCDFIEYSSQIPWCKLFKQNLNPFSFVKRCKKCLDAEMEEMERK